VPTSIDPQPLDDEVECARCGGYFFYELTRCPHCGVNIYEPEDEIEEDSDSSMQSSPTHARGVVEGFLGFLRRFFGGSDLAEELFAPSKEQVALFDNLLHKVGGDPAIVERLISFESDRLPDGNRTEWLKQAIWRWERDNR
jgi:hypothetical protein